MLGSFVPTPILYGTAVVPKLKYKSKESPGHKRGRLPYNLTVSCCVQAMLQERCNLGVRERVTGLLIVDYYVHACNIGSRRCVYMWLDECTKTASQD